MEISQILIRLKNKSLRKMRAYSIIYFISAITVSFVGAYSNLIYNLAVDMAEYCRISYCIKGFGNYDFLIDAPSLQTGDISLACPTLDFCQDNKDIEIVQILNPNISKAEISGSGYVAINHAKRHIIVVSRGSYTIQDWVSDFEFALVPYKRCSFCTVHKGVYMATEVIKKQAWDTIKNLLNKYPDYELIATGHSLGGGLTALVGLEMQLDFKKRVTVVSLAGLKIGNNHLAEFIDETFNSSKYLESVNDNDANGTQFGGFLRVVHEADIVPLIPPTPLYSHGGIELYINKVRLPHPQESTEIKGMYKYEPLSSQLFNILSQKSLQETLTIYEHNNYFMYIYGCNSTSVADFIPGPNPPTDGNITAAALRATMINHPTSYSRSTLVASVTTY